MDTPVRVLVVDDDPDLREATGRVLAQAGYVVELAADGAEAQAALQFRRPDLILLDRQLPDLDGLELCRELKRAPGGNETFVILLSGVYTQSAQQVDGLEAGADGTIARPIGNQELLARVQAFVRMLRLQRSLQRQADELRESNESLDRARQATLNLLEDAVATRERAEHSRRALQESERRFRAFLENSATVAWAKDAAGRFVFLSHNYERRFGVRFDDWRGKTDFEVWPSEVARVFRENDLTVLRENRTIEVIESAVEPDGTISWWQSSKFPFPDADGSTCVGGLAVEITKQKLAEEELARQNCLYQMLSRVNEAIVRVRNSPDLFASVCRIAVEQGEFQLAAVIGFEAASGQALVLAQAGDDDEYFAPIAVNLGDARLNCGTIATAYVSGHYEVCNDFAHDPRMAAWQGAALQRGYGSIASFPIRAEGEVCAVLVLLAGEAEFFQEEEIQLLLAVAEDLSYALDAMTDEQQRREAEGALRASLAEKNSLLQEIHHRVKNNLQVISSLVNLQAMNFRETPLFPALQETQARIRSMALLHETLYRAGNLAQVDLPHYIESLASQLFRTFGADIIGRVRLDLDLAPVSLSLDQAVPCGLILNELLTNALKYAFPAERSGRIAVRVREAWQPGSEAAPSPNDPVMVRGGASCIEVTVTDDGVGLPAGLDPGQAPTLGLQLVQTLVEQLAGNLEIRRSGGTQFVLTFCPKGG